MRMYIDSHAHLLLDETVEEELKRASQASLQAIIDICTNEKTLRDGVELQAKIASPKIYLVASTTPHDVAKDGEHFFPIVERFAKEKKLVAIGETGLDYYY